MHEYIELIKKEVKPALGCTEPIAVALAVAKACEVVREAGAQCATLDVKVSANILKNGMGVGIPGTGMVGLHIASALAFYCGKSEYGLEVLKDLTGADVLAAKEMVDGKKVTIALADTDKKLYVEALCTSEDGTHSSKVVIADTHDSIVYVEGDGVQLPGEPGKRTSWKSENIKNSMKKTVNPYYLTNIDNIHGTYYSVTATLKKDFHSGLSLMAAYTRSDSKSLQEGYGDQVSSLFSGGNYSVNGSNVPELGHSAFVTPNRVIANVSYRIKEGKHLATTIGMFYEGFNHCYVGSYSYTRYSYTFGVRSGNYVNDVSGVGGSQNLMYIPTDADLAKMTFKDEENKAAFKKFIEEDSYLSAHRGEYAERGAKAAPWQHRFNVKLAQDFILNTAKKPTTLQLGVDLNNVANLLNSNWGLTKQVSSENILEISKANETGVYTFNAPVIKSYRSTFNTWQLLFSARLFF